MKWQKFWNSSFSRFHILLKMVLIQFVLAQIPVIVSPLQNENASSGEPLYHVLHPVSVKLEQTLK